MSEEGYTQESDLLSDRVGERSPHFLCFILFNPQNSLMGVDFSLILPLEIHKLEAHRIIHPTSIDLSTSYVSTFTEVT